MMYKMSAEAEKRGLHLSYVAQSMRLGAFRTTWTSFLCEIILDSGNSVNFPFHDVKVSRYPHHSAPCLPLSDILGAQAAPLKHYLDISSDVTSIPKQWPIYRLLQPPPSPLSMLGLTVDQKRPLHPRPRRPSDQHDLMKRRSNRGFRKRSRYWTKQKRNKLVDIDLPLISLGVA